MTQFEQGDRPQEARGTQVEQVVVASFGSYAEAERAVDYLSDNRFPVRHTAIVGRGLSSVEQVTGRLTAWRAAGQSALSGMLLGALFGWLFGLIGWIAPMIAYLLLAVYGAVFGAVVGGLIGLASHALTGGRRDFSSISAMRADRYDVMVESLFATEAVHLLSAPGAPGRGIV